jgi:hypothetical protein
MFLLMSGVHLASAQTTADVFVGANTATDKSSGQGIDTFGDGVIYNTPKMGGLFGNAGADVMVTPHFGVGGEVNFRFSQGSYAGLNYRPIFYDFNGIWQPTAKSKRFVPEFQAGLGGVNVRFYENQSACDAFGGCSSSNTFVESSNHLQLHFSAGLRYYIRPHIFVRPQFDLHWVHNFFQFGSNFVPQYGVSVGYTMGER